MMRAGFFISFFMLMAVIATAQKTMPDFRIATIAGKYISSADVAIKKPVLLIYFEPDCHDCQQFTSLLVREDVIFKRYQVIMITNAGMDQLKQFNSTYKLGKKPVLIGTEGWTRTVQRALNVASFPFVALYDKKRKLVKILDKGKPEQIIKQLI